MQLINHCGAKEIGNICVEIKTDKTRIVIGFGKSIDNLAEEKSIDAIIIPHFHMDFYGFLSYVHSGIPIYMSQEAQELIEISGILTSDKIVKINSHVINTKKTFNIGDIKITPYLVDYSVFDALAFLIEADDKRIFYSGDYRARGHKSVLFKRIIPTE